MKLSLPLPWAMADTSGLPLSNLDHSNWLATPSPPPCVPELEVMQYY